MSQTRWALGSVCDSYRRDSLQTLHIAFAHRLQWYGRFLTFLKLSKQSMHWVAGFLFASIPLTSQVLGRWLRAFYLALSCITLTVPRWPGSIASIILKWSCSPKLVLVLIDFLPEVGAPKLSPNELSCALPGLSSYLTVVRCFLNSLDIDARPSPAYSSSGL